MVRALASHECGPGSTPGVDAICGLSLLLVLSLAQRGFSPGTPVFPSPQKPTFPNSNSTRNHVDEEPLCGCATCKSLFIYFIFYLFIIRFPSQTDFFWRTPFAFRLSRAWDGLSFNISTALVIVISVATMYSALLHYSHSCNPSSLPIHSSYSFHLSVHLPTKPLILGLFIYCTL